MFFKRCYEVGQIMEESFMMIVLPSLIVLVIMLIPAYIINFNQRRSKRDKRVTVSETNLYRREEDDDIEWSEPVEIEREKPIREKPIYENRIRDREPVRSTQEPVRKTQRRPRENFKKSDNSDLK
ncbi:MAG: hypothetical protein J7604_09790 [Sporocytophaga sp.]|uniref:hypothetical protein n=1 Tax=Sporocytophaga sp. TaxID=2231183 RepID=UPI001B2D517E|nr:hypothetical protein [Sporocytophaga sp.]MBO9700487.1 hypothetical protein [Sporocytophaga sp.]